jgi:hypothetical protein
MYSEAKTIGIIFLLVAATFSCTNLQKEKEVVNEELPNIVLLLGDELGWDEVGYNSHPFVKTPVLDDMQGHL